MMISALTTNAVSNALHATFLFLYLVGSLFHYMRAREPVDRRFSLLIVLFFLVIFILKLLGVYVHYYDIQAALAPQWLAIVLLGVFLNYLTVYAMQVPTMPRLIVVFFSLAATFFYLISSSGSFAYVALPLLVTYAIAAYYAEGLLRNAFIMVIFSNVFWLLTRGIENDIVGHTLSPEYLYDNDGYHILLIISTFMIYRAISKGYWKLPNSS